MLTALGQPTILGLSWHCSVHVSMVKEPLAGAMTRRKRFQARKAKLGPYTLSGSAESGWAPLTAGCWEGVEDFSGSCGRVAASTRSFESMPKQTAMATIDSRAAESLMRFFMELSLGMLAVSAPARGPNTRRMQAVKRGGHRASPSATALLFRANAPSHGGFV
jgi:hypothetical protein